MYLLGIDVGTTNTKALVFDTDIGQVCSVGQARTLTRHPKREWSEFDADELWQTVMLCLHQAITRCGHPEQIRAIAVASMGEAGFPIDTYGNVLSPAIAWHDPRTMAQAQWWNDTLGREQIYAITGQVLHPMFGINKLLWIRDNQPDVFQRMHCWLSVEDFILWKLSGCMATDYSIASRTMMFDQHTHTWSETLFKHAGIASTCFPSVVPSGVAIGTVAKHIVEDIGLSPTTVVVTGGHDHLCAAFAAGVVQPGQVLDSTGTAGVVLALSNMYQASNELRVAGYPNYAYVVPNTYVTMGSINVGGGAIEWMINLLYGKGTHAPLSEEVYKEALQEVVRVAPGSEGITILPYFLGTGTPQGQDTATATFLGITPAHERPELVRAVIEGLGFWLRDNLETFARLHIVPSQPEMIAVGGATRASEVMQIKANITGCRIRAPLLLEAAATGAALLAGLGIGAFHSVHEAIGSIQLQEKVYEPEQAVTRQYDDLYHNVYVPARHTILKT